MPSATILRAVIAATGLSRRKAFEAVRAGRVTCAGETVLDPSRPFGGGDLALDGRPLVQPTAPKTYLVLNKPPGYLSAVSDDRGRPTVLDLVPAGLRAPGLHPVGRLDLDTSGLLVLTNDGDLTYRLTHPRYEVEKEYWAAVSPAPDATALERLRRGIEIDGALRRPVALKRLSADAGFDLAITIREGRKREVRRMLEAAGLRVTRLRRVREGGLALPRLAEGAVRPLTPSELRLLSGEKLRNG